MSDNIIQDGAIENFLNKHLVKLLWGVALYYLVQLSNDFKDVKLTLQTVVTNQSIMDARMKNLEDNVKKQDTKWEDYDKEKAEFYKTYILKKKDGN